MKDRSVRSSAKAHESAFVILRLYPTPNKNGVDYKRIEDGLKSLSGVFQVQLSFTNNNVKVVYDPKRLTVEVIRKKLEKLHSKLE